MREEKKGQRVCVFQQRGSGEAKIAGLRRYGGGNIDLRVISIDDDLPPVVEDSREYLPKGCDCDLVVDFLTHPDLSADLAQLCRDQGLPLVASGKKHAGPGMHCPPT